MKRKVWITPLVLALAAAIQFGCQKAAAPPTNLSGTDTNTNSAREVVDTAAIERELLKIENDWPRVIKEKDAEAVRRVEADDIVLVYPDGSTGGKAQDVKDMETGSLTADSIEMADLKVHVLDADSAFVSGRTIVKKGKYKMPDGKSIDISGEYRFIDTFHKRDGKWQVVAGASVPIRQPAAPAAAMTPAK
jgi:ketosteroid isomerase-like protein